MDEKKKPGREKSNKNLRSFDKINPEEAKEIRKKGGQASQEAKRKYKEIAEKKMFVRDFVKKHLFMNTTHQQSAVLQSLGFEPDDCINLNLFISSLFAKAVSGDTRAAELYMTIGGLTGEEVRRDSEEERKKEESKVRVEAMRSTMGKGMNVESGDENGSVIIYMPEIEKIEEDE